MIRLAIIGSGPAGFYTAHRLLQRSIRNLTVEMYEALPVPFGLVRYGVAPDHPEVKNVEHTFSRVAENERFKFLGNISIGRDLPISILQETYDAIVFAYGAGKDKELGIPGEHNLTGILSARSFVNWYNGLYGYSELPIDLSGETASIIGMGNVALDCARILLSPIEQLEQTDIAEHALQALSRSSVKRVNLIGRRGVLQTAFTTKEVREMMNLSGVSFHTQDPNIFSQTNELLGALSRPQKRLLQVLERGSSTKVGHKSWHLYNLRSPHRFKGDNCGHLQHIELEINRLENTQDIRSARAIGKDEYELIESSLCLKSIGYRSEPLKGFAEVNIPFDDKRTIIPNHMGKVGKTAGLYVSGWVKRGATGVIASTMYDAFETADTICEDLESGRVRDSGRVGWEGIERSDQGRRLRPVFWKDWERINKMEIEIGKQKGKSREKIVNYSELLSTI